VKTISGLFSVFWVIFERIKPSLSTSSKGYLKDSFDDKESPRFVVVSSGP